MIFFNRDKRDEGDPGKLRWPLSHLVGMKPLVLLLLAPALGAQQPFTSSLGQEPVTRIDLAPAGCWEGLLLSARQGVSVPSQKPKASERTRIPEATVEILDFAYQETRAQETFRLFREQLLLNIRENWRFAPPSHGRMDLAIRGSGLPGKGNDLAMVQSLHQRFNRLPPHGSPAQVGSAR